MAHKLAHYVAHLQDGVQTPDAAETVLRLMLEQPQLFTIAMGLYIPGPEPDWDLDRWWAEVVRLHREAVKRDLIDVYGPLCECCGLRVGYDMHEVFRPRSTDTSWRQIFLFSLSNCALVCPECHQSGVVYGNEFKEMIRVRRELLTEGGIG